jgi:hypothetical protein
MGGRERQSGAAEQARRGNATFSSSPCVSIMRPAQCGDRRDETGSRETTAANLQVSPHNTHNTRGDEGATGGGRGIITFAIITFGEGEDRDEVEEVGARNQLACAQGKREGKTELGHDRIVRRAAHCRIVAADLSEAYAQLFFFPRPHPPPPPRHPPPPPSLIITHRSQAHSIKSFVSVVSYPRDWCAG